jgi:cholesterol transport system auxiliary component
MKILAFILLGSMLFVQGCFSTSNYYLLSVAPTPKIFYQTQEKIIGVEKVTLPSYLYKRELMMATSTREVILLPNALWVEDLDIGLTHRIIAFLQKKFKQPNVYAYPWGVMRQVDIKVTLNITRFIVEQNTVYLEATWSLESLETKHRISELFSITFPSTNDSQSIVFAMDKAFASLEEAIALGIKKF